MRVFLSVVFFGCAIAAASQPKTETGPLPLFSIGEQQVTTDEFLYTYRKNHPNKQDYTEDKIDEYLELFINFKLKVMEARTRGLDTTAKFETEFKTYREELKKPYRTEPDALEKLTKETYQRLTEEIRAAHILIALKPDATPADTTIAYQKISHLKSRVLAGEDFEKLARELSEDPSAKYNGGDLGYFTALQMVFPFEDAAYKTPVGNVSAIIRTRFGYHLIKVKDRKPSRGEVEVSHILIRTAQDEAKVKNTIFSVYDQLKGGRSWDEVCKEYSEDPNTREAGGRLKPFGVGALSSVPEFEAMAFSMQQPGDISDPFQSAIGWHIIRLESKIPLPSFKEMEPSLRRRVSRDERLQLSQQTLQAKRRKEFSFHENEAVKQQVVALADSSLIRGAWKYAGAEELRTETLFSVQEKGLQVNELIQYIYAHQKPTAGSPISILTQLYEALVEEKIAEAEEAKLMREHPDFRNLLNEYREGILLFEIMETEIWGKASADSAGQKQYFEQNQSRYQAGERLEARIFSASDKSVIEEMQKKIARGDTLKDSDLKKFKSIQNFRTYERKDNKVIDQISWSTGLHEAEMDGLFYLVEVKRLIAPGLKTYEEARPQVIADYQDYLEKDWVTGLRDTYRVKINKKGKKFVIAQLTAK
jgi:peptidyl-prolyl cis-trans isomerase SurA